MHRRGLREAHGYQNIDMPSGKSQEDWTEELHHTLKREVETLSNMSHPYIVDYITSQGWDGPLVEIFMGLKDGTLESLVESGVDASAVANSVFPQMLQALDCIAWKGIVHRDVKPENILYISQQDGQYQFQLGDFGLCNRIIDAATFAGSRLYMAPEIFQKSWSNVQIRCLVTLCHDVVDIGHRRAPSEVTSMQELVNQSRRGPRQIIRERAATECRRQEELDKLTSAKLDTRSLPSASKRVDDDLGIDREVTNVVGREYQPGQREASTINRAEEQQISPDVSRLPSRPQQLRLQR